MRPTLLDFLRLARTVALALVLTSLTILAAFGVVLLAMQRAR